ncbi:hypothetical protein BBK82_07545 [Lentzea guizhouensis]|uniref:Thioredoxin domain-containing protein n=1 Tax=Lentzea guizhouensis TaxID=1586287 RepID=A0A1B2HE00_9PSEU|nr:redoxin domain-containing protein [Lentzea guizhouensis]ANZ35957.1 hypothetical protein BBK82_07545 [Lentzea guizhouensis]
MRFTARTLDGAEISGAALAGKPVVLWFWAPWCPKCQREAPGMSKELGSSVTFVGVAALDQVPAMQGFVDRYDLKSSQHIADTPATGPCDLSEGQCFCGAFRSGRCGTTTST